MKIRHLLLVTMFLATAGCAGGWRDGAGPGAIGMAQTATAATAPAKAVNTGASHAMADGAVFIFKGTANSVNVAGEFNAWSTSADALTKQADGTWSLEKKLAAGRYMYKFVVNGSDWKQDTDAPDAADDGFGGKNSVMVVGASAAAGAAAPAAAKPAAAAAAPVATGDGATFKFSGAGNTVNVAGEFNNWSTSADALTKQADGSWAITKKLAPGRYMYKFVVDGSNWKEDPNAKETADDGFGGKNAVMVVGGAAGAVAAAPAAAKPTGAAAAPVASGDGATFKFSGAGNTVNLAGDFNNWSTSADALTKQADGSWSITKKLAPGRYMYKFVVDGSNWKEDPNAKETVDDGFGGKNAVMVVGGAASAAAAAPAAAKPAAAAAPAAAKPLASGVKPKAPQATAAGVVFTYAGAAKSTVALCGDFNNWAPNADALTQSADGTWTLTKKLPAGAHSYKFLVDGSNWKPDDGNPNSSDDGFGGKNSVITVK